MTHRRPSLTSIFHGFSLIALTLIARPAAAQAVTTPGGSFPSETYAGVLVNGTTDWVTEEELSLRDAFRWSPDNGVRHRLKH